MPRQPADQHISTVFKPKDFDKFWADVMGQVNSIPLDASIVHIPLRSTPEIDVYEVHYTSLDEIRIAGWYCVPKNYPRPLPAILHVPGYLMEPPIPKNWARKGYAAFSAAPRGKLRSHHQFNPGYPGLLTHNINDPNTYTYRGFYADACRAIDFLIEQEEVDGTRIGVTGHSQGGGLTISTAALRPQVKAASAGAPYLCGFMDSIRLTSTYPYQEIANYLRLHPEQQSAVEKSVSYFDGENLATKVTCPIIVSLGLQDNVCPPETGYSLFEAISSKDKNLYAYDGHGHDAGQFNHAAIIDSFFAEHLGLGQ